MPEGIITMVASWPVALQVVFAGGVLLVAYAHGPKLYHAAKSKITGNGNGQAASTRHAVEELRGELVPRLDALIEEIRRANEALKQEFDVTRRAAREMHADVLAAQKHTDELILTRRP